MTKHKTCTNLTSSPLVVGDGPSQVTIPFCWSWVRRWVWFQRTWTEVTFQLRQAWARSRRSASSKERFAHTSDTLRLKLAAVYLNIHTHKPMMYSITYYVCIYIIIYILFIYAIYVQFTFIYTARVVDMSHRVAMRMFNRLQLCLLL